jgi:thiamine pyrophosphokinase
MTDGRRTVRRALVLADGDRPTRAALDAAWPGWADGIDYVIAADGGARLAVELGFRLDAWVGDGDSISAPDLEALRRAGVPVELAARDKDESDAELALLAAVAAGAAEVTLVGALGGPRLDHALANVSLLAHPSARGVELRILGPNSRLRLLQAPGADGAAADAELPGQVGDLVSLIPFGDVAGVTTDGLRYPLHGEDLALGPARGLSNVRTRPIARVTVREGRLLVVEVPATLPE